MDSLRDFPARAATITIAKSLLAPQSWLPLVASPRCRNNGPLANSAIACEMANRPREFTFAFATTKSVALAP